MLVTELRPYQAKALQDIRDTVRGGVFHFVVQAATGAGKTKIAAAIVDGALEKRKRVAFVVPAISLVDQTVESFWEEGIRDIGVIQANHMMSDWSRSVQVCSVQTLQSRGVYPEADTVIIDECHRLHEAHKKWLEDPAWKNVPMIGLSATPWTRGLKKYFDSLLIAATTKDLIDQGYLSKFRVFATGHPDLAGVKITAGDYNEGQLSEAMQKGTLTADIINTWKKHWGKDKTLCFAVDKVHAKSLQERFEWAGVTCGYQDADTPADERREIKRKFHSGEYQVVVNIQTLTTGVDWDVRCLILARPTRSEMLYVQIIGRALRTAVGKDEALILDHSDTTSRLGFVTDIHHDGLDDGKPADKTPQEQLKKEPLPKVCEQCSAVLPFKIKKCPNCGHENKRMTDVVEVDGELIEIAPGRLLKVQSPNKVWQRAERIVFFRELLGYAKDHGYKNGWAKHKYQERFGEWPPVGHTTPAKVQSPGTLQWIKSRNIAWAHSKRRPLKREELMDLDNE